MDIPKHLIGKQLSTEDPSIENILKVTQEYFPIQEQIHPTLELILKNITGPQLLKLSVLKKELFVYGQDLFKRLCELENIAEHIQNVSYAESYAKRYFQLTKNDERKKFAWEVELLTMNATKRVERMNDYRDKTVLKTKMLERPPPSKSNKNRVLPHSSSSESMCSAPNSVSKAPKTPKKKSKKENEKGKMARRQKHTCTPLFEKCKKQRLQLLF